MARTKTKTKTAKRSASNILAALTQKQSSSKSSSPTIRIDNEELTEQIVSIVQAKRLEKEAKSAVKLAEGSFADTARQMFENKCKEDVSLHSSVKFLCDGGQITYTQVKRLCKMMEIDVSDRLHQIFGEDFDANFEIEKPLSIACNKLTDNQICKVVEALQKVLDDDTFDEVVDYSPQIMAKKQYFARRILDSEISRKSKLAENEGIAKPFAASFKA